MAEKKLDPITFEILKHKLEQIIAEAYYTIGRVSGSAVVYEAGDHQEAILTADGELVLFGAGVLHWTPVMAMAAKHMVEKYEDNPGIFQDDQFVFNDPYIGCLHAPDVQIHAPVFWEGKRIAWASASSHQLDVGGMDPGGIMVRPEEVVQEGLQLPGLKYIERGVIKRDVEACIRNMVRLPDLFMLDISAKVAANNVIKTRLQEMIKRYGMETVITLFDQMIHTSEEMVRAKLREIPDGEWKSIGYLEGMKTPYIKVELTLIKEGDTLTFDFTGTSPQVPASENVALPGAIGSAVDPFVALMCHDIPWSQGIFKPLQFVIPDGSLINPKRPAPVSYNTPSGAAYLVIAVSQNALSKMLLSTEKFRNEACGNPGASGYWPVLSGLNKDENYFTTIIMEGLAGGTGGLPDRDGDNCSGNMWCAKVMIANIEMNELQYPILYLMRREVPDTGGMGKFRGGAALMYALIPWDTPGKTLVNVQLGHGQEPRHGAGLSGGYPAANTQLRIIRNADVLGKIKQGRLPRELDEIQGEIEIPHPKSIFVIGEKDVYCAFQGGGGGFGDPFERDPKLVREDVIKRNVTLKSANEICGVVINPETLEIDWEKTQEQRCKIIEERLKDEKRINLSSVYPQRGGNGVRVLENLEIVEIEGKKVFRCLKCRHTLGPANEDYKNFALKNAAPLSKAQPVYLAPKTDIFVLREYYCPECAAMFEIDMVTKDEKQIHSIRLKE